MSKQIFKKIFPKEQLLEFIDKFALKTDNYYLINKSYYKKAQYINIINSFIEKIKPYYHTSKIKYTENITSYSKFMTIIRQLCKINEISYVSKILYNKSTYDINYFIYF